MEVCTVRRSSRAVGRASSIVDHAIPVSDLGDTKGKSIRCESRHLCQSDKAAIDSLAEIRSNTTVVHGCKQIWCLRSPFVVIGLQCPIVIWTFISIGYRAREDLYIPYCCHLHFTGTCKTRSFHGSVKAILLSTEALKMYWPILLPYQSSESGRANRGQTLVAPCSPVGNVQLDQLLLLRVAIAESP